MKSDQTKTQSNFVTVFIVVICGILEALFSLSCDCFYVFYSHLPVTTHRHLFSGTYFIKLSVSMALSDWE
jgi:hypothetical protein